MTILYMILAVLLLQHGTVGLVIANIIVMTFRIAVGFNTINNKLFNHKSQFIQFINQIFPDFKLILSS